VNYNGLHVTAGHTSLNTSFAYLNLPCCCAPRAACSGRNETKCTTDNFCYWDAASRHNSTMCKMDMLKHYCSSLDAGACSVDTACMTVPMCFGPCSTCEGCVMFMYQQVRNAKL
jgi:hypothetical protein